MLPKIRRSSGVADVGLRGVGRFPKEVARETEEGLASRPGGEADEDKAA
jgi:hypothetical protein